MTFPIITVEAAFPAGAQSSGASYLYLDDPVRGKLDSGNTLAGTIWTDISAYVRGLSVTRGSNRIDGPNVRYEAGTARVVLDNTSRAFDPTNTSGPFAVAGVSNVQPMRAIRIRASYGSNLVGNGTFETDIVAWSANANTSISRTTAQAAAGNASLAMTSLGAGNISAFTYRSPVTGGATYTAMASFKSQASARSAKVSLDWYDSAGVYISTSDASVITTTTAGWTVSSGNVTAPASAAYAAPVTWVLATGAAGEVHWVDQVGIFLGAGQVWSPYPTAYPVFRGFADEWAINYDGPNESVCVLSATDAIKVLSNFNGVAQTAQGAGEDTGARITRILNNAGWSASDRSIATGNTTTQATTLAGSAWTEMLLTVDTELGELYVDGDGKVVFRNRLATYTDQRSKNSQATFGDGTGELAYVDGGIELSYDDTQVTNLVRTTRVGGVQQTAQDAGSQQNYLTRTWERNDLIMQTDAAAQDYANWVLVQRKDPELRFSTVKVNPRTDEDNLFPQVLGRQFGDRITVVRRPPGGGTISRDVFIRGVRHDVRALQWTTTWVLESATQYDTFLILDDPVRGKLDTGRLAY